VFYGCCLKWERNSVFQNHVVTLYRTLPRTIDYVKENFVKINIFFKEMNYESIDQVPGYGFSSLLADIGGNMGLFIGASVLTVIELFDFVYEIMKVKCGRLVRKFDLA